MRFDREHAKIAVIASSDTTRTNIVNLHLDVDRQRLCATDGHRLMILPVQLDEHDVSGPISAESIQAAAKTSKAKKSGVVQILANGSLAIPDGPTFPRPTHCGPFPPVDQVIPEMKRGDHGTVTFGLNAKYLWELAQALGGEGFVAITVKLPDRGHRDQNMLDPILVHGKHQPDSGPVAILMPARI